MIKDEKGQSTIEFLVSFIFVLSFFLTFFNLALNSTNGFLLHYATFMSSRAYLVHDNNSNTPNGGDGDAQAIATTVFENFNLGAFLKADGGTSIKFHHPDSGKKAVYTGAVASYKDKFTASSFFGGDNPIEYVSESFLGREPTRGECSERVCRAMQDIGASCELHITFFDNGC